MSQQIIRIRQLTPAEINQLKQISPERKGTPIKYVPSIKESPQGQYVNQNLAWIVYDQLKQNDVYRNTDTTYIQREILPKTQFTYEEIEIIKQNYESVFGLENSTNIITQREENSKNVEVKKTITTKRDYSASALRYGRLYGLTLNNRS